MADRKRILVTDHDLENFDRILKLIQEHDKTDEFGIDLENADLQETIRRAKRNLKNFDSYFSSVEERPGGWYNAHCVDCGWFGSSEYCGGGGQIADTGDYDDPTCPVCESPNIN